MIKKIVTGILFLSVMASFATSETKIKYISPNNDGVKDSLEIPFKVSANFSACFFSCSFW